MGTELEKAIGNAFSFPGSEPPEEAVEIGRVNHAGTVFIYFRGNSGTLYYGTERGMEFARQMEEKQKKKKSTGSIGTRRNSL